MSTFESLAYQALHYGLLFIMIGSMAAYAIFWILFFGKIVATVLQTFLGLSKSVAGTNPARPSVSSRSFFSMPENLRKLHGILMYCWIGAFLSAILLVILEIIFRKVLKN